jgi:hypothetical protein
MAKFRYDKHKEEQHPWKQFPLSSMYTYNTVYDYNLFHYSPLSHHILCEAKIKNIIIIW